MRTDDTLWLVTGGTGLVGSHVCERAVAEGRRIRALVRPGSDRRFLESLGVEIVTGDLNDPATLPAAVRGVTHLIHCAARVGDWGPVIDYQRDNVGGLQNLLSAFASALRPVHVVHISTLGVYPARDHHQTDESTPVNVGGIDGYTRSKVETELALLESLRTSGNTAVLLRPGFIYGPRDRTVIPRLVERIRSGKFAFLGSGKALMNNTFVGNLVDAVFLAIDRPDLSGEAFNITDGRLVSKKEFVEAVCRHARLPIPTRHVPAPVARGLAAALETTWRLLGRKSPPPLSRAAVKFLGFHLDYSIAKARERLGYRPAVDLQDGMALALKGEPASSSILPIGGGAPPPPRKASA